MATSQTKVRSNGATPADLAEQVETLRADLSALTQTIADLGKQKGDQATSAAKAKLSDARDAAADTAETVRLQALELQGQANDFVVKQPATALGIAAGVGFLIGFFGSRK